MQCTVNRQQLLNNLKAMKKVFPVIESLFLEIEDDILILRVRQAEAFNRRYVSVEGTVKPGKIVINYKFLEDVLTTNKSVETLSFRSINNNLKITAGKSSYRTFLKNEKVRDPEIPEDTLKISAKNTAIFRSMLEQVKFKMIINSELENSPVLITNTEDSLNIKCSDSIYCTFYEGPSISKESFELSIYLDAIQAVFSDIHTTASIAITEDSFYLESNELFARVPTLQTGIEHIRNAEKMVMNEDLFENDIRVGSKQLKEIADVIKIVADDSDSFSFSIKKDKIFTKLKTNMGSAKHIIDCESDITESIIIPYLSYNYVVNSQVSSEVIFQIHNQGKCYKLTSSNKDITVTCIAPTSVM